MYRTIQYLVPCTICMDDVVRSPRTHDGSTTQPKFARTTTSISQNSVSQNVPSTNNGEDTKVQPSDTTLHALAASAQVQPVRHHRLILAPETCLMWTIILPLLHRGEVCSIWITWEQELATPAAAVVPCVIDQNHSIPPEHSMFP